MSTISGEWKLPFVLFENYLKDYSEFSLTSTEIHFASKEGDSLTTTVRPCGFQNCASLEATIVHVDGDAVSRLCVPYTLIPNYYDPIDNPENDPKNDANHGTTIDLSMSMLKSENEDLPLGWYLV